MTRSHTRRGAEILHDRADDWRDQARCLNWPDPELWFPHESESAQGAKDVCAECDVRQQCLQFALDNRIEHGVYGGLTVKERKRLAKATGKHRTHKCVVCGEKFNADPRARPLYCDDCRPAAYRKRGKKYDDKNAPPYPWKGR